MKCGGQVISTASGSDPVVACQMPKRVVIIGGGFAGLAAAVELSERGADVLLLERRRHLGGRAYSFTDTVTGDVVDNGQHLFMGCYANTIRFLEKIGRLDGLRFQSSPRVEFLDRENGFTAFDCPPLPAPLHALVGLFRMRGLTPRDKLRTLNVARALRASTNGKPGPTVSKWLDGLRQSERIKKRFWYPMAIATLNEDPEIASSKMLRKVLEVAFDGSRKDASIGIARVGLSDLYTTGACSFVESRGGTIRTGAEVRSLTVQQGRAVACELAGNERVEADWFISAVPPSAFLKMLPREMQGAEFASLGSLNSSPIVSVNLWFDRPVTDREFVGLLGTNIQWLFNKDVIVSPGTASNHLALVISAARGFVGMTKSALTEMALAELRELLPAARAANLVHSRVVKEPDATLSHTVESDSIRPGPRTSIHNLLLAGDWTDTGLPATIESAVLSGNIASSLCLEGSERIHSRRGNKPESRERGPV